MDDDVDVDDETFSPLIFYLSFVSGAAKQKKRLLSLSLSQESVVFFS
jgi:hypothetical protein